MTKGQLIRGSDTPVVMSTGGAGALASASLANGSGSDSEIPYRALLRRHGRAIGLILLCSVVASLVVTFLMTPSYKAKAVIEVMAANQDFLNNKEVDPNMSGSTMDTYLDTETRLLKSEAVSDRVSALLLAHAAEYQQRPESPLKRLEQQLGLSSPTKEAVESDISKTMASLQVKPEGQSSLIAITVSGPTAELAADAANAVAKQHIAELQEAKVAMATQTTQFLSGQLDSLRNKLQQSENALQAYAKKNGLVFTSDVERESVDAAKLREVQSDLEKAEADTADKRSQLELSTSGPAAALPRVQDDGALRDADSKLADLRRQYAILSDLYTPKHYKVREVKAQIDAIEDSIKNQRALVIARLGNDYRAAARREALQRENYERQLALVSNQSAKQIGYNTLKREVDANRDLFQSLSKDLREASLAAALRVTNIRVVDRAKRPLFPYQPNAVVNTGVGILAGCMMSILFVLIRERSDGSIRTAGLTMKVLQMRELAIIPSARRDIRTQIVSPPKNGKLRLSRPFTKDPPLQNATKDIVQSWKTTRSIVAESFRSAVASILLWGRNADMTHKMLVITSAHSSAGKTTSTLNLGLGLVESGRRVLLIDGDLRVPRLGPIFGLNSAAGLTSILVERLHPAIASELICETGLEGLHVLPSGPLYMNVAELLHLDALGELLEFLRSQYDFILIDSPPALPLTDARLLAQHADGVILVVKAGATTVEQTLTVQQCFQQDGTAIFGSILNHWDARAEDPTYMTSYMKYAVSSGHSKIAAVQPGGERPSPVAGKNGGGSFRMDADQRNGSN
jgi:succinoglycan biosynthesis transport protein ExoP